MKYLYLKMSDQVREWYNPFKVREVVKVNSVIIANIKALSP